MPLGSRINNRIMNFTKKKVFIGLSIALATVFTLHFVSQLKYKKEKHINRAGLDSGQISMNKAQETIGGEFYWQIPNDFGLMVDVRNNGVPLVIQAPKASITRSIIELCEKLNGNIHGDDDGKRTDKSKPQKKGLFGFLKK